MKSLSQLKFQTKAKSCKLDWATGEVQSQSYLRDVKVFADHHAYRAFRSVIETQQAKSLVLPVRELTRNTKPKIKSLECRIDFEPELNEFWYPVTFSKKLKASDIEAIKLFGEPWTIFRDQDGKPACVKDQCAHRSCPLSLGHVKDGKIVCPYHGWAFGSKGECTDMPSTKFIPGMVIDSIKCIERDGIIWVWPGCTTPKNPPTFAREQPGYKTILEVTRDLDVDGGLLLENILDVAHVKFTHEFASNWPRLECIKFETIDRFLGNWNPVPIDNEFQPPCGAVNVVGMTDYHKLRGIYSQKDCVKHMRQVYSIAPTEQGKCRLLYRISLDYMHWIRHIPGVRPFLENAVDKVLSEDLYRVAGQQKRLVEDSANLWDNPVPYDKLAMGYRKWRNSLSKGSIEPEVRVSKVKKSEAVADKCDNMITVTRVNRN